MATVGVLSLDGRRYLPVEAPEVPTGAPVGTVQCQDRMPTRPGEAYAPQLPAGTRVFTVPGVSADCAVVAASSGVQLFEAEVRAPACSTAVRRLGAGG